MIAIDKSIIIMSEMLNFLVENFTASHGYITDNRIVTDDKMIIVIGTPCFGTVIMSVS